jgi:hypothetical protein
LLLSHEGFTEEDERAEGEKVRRGIDWDRWRLRRKRGGVWRSARERSVWRADAAAAAAVGEKQEEEEEEMRRDLEGEGVARPSGFVGRRWGWVLGARGEEEGEERRKDLLGEVDEVVEEAVNAEAERGQCWRSCWPRGGGRGWSGVLKDSAIPSPL